VDIDKGIPNAITLLFQKLSEHPSHIVEVTGGERRNSIPKTGEITFGLERYEAIEGAHYLGEQEAEVMRDSTTLIALLSSFESGVRAHNSELGIVQTSINLALIETAQTTLRVQLSGRSMDHNDLKELENETRVSLEKAGFETRSEGFYSPWKPEKNDFSKLVLEETKSLFPKAAYGAIHAGLECGIIKERFPQVEMASIGPNILYPHSNREKVELASVQRVFSSLQNIVRRVHEN
jgi:dipeptidase D